MYKDESETLKEIRLDRQRAFENEERVLSLVRELRHSNMLKLYGSYSLEKSGRNGSYRVHNLLFPLAGGSLSSLLWDKNKDALLLHLSSEENVFRQLYGLASAIASFHNYYNEEYQLHLIGCHRDLNPKNILVSEGRLLLADFGLSQLRQNTSDSMFKTGKGS